jgi:class 3 adenylate cyclase
VDEVQFKGFDEPERIYRVVSKPGIRVFTDQFILLTDAHGFTDFFKANGTETIEEFLLEYDELMNTVCEQHGGEIRQVNGDLYSMTFTGAKQTLDAITLICRNWDDIGRRFNLGLDMGVHKGDLYAFRSYVFGGDINIALSLANFSGPFKSRTPQAFVVASGRLRDEFIGTAWADLFQLLDANMLTRDKDKSLLREHGAYRLLVE